MEKEDSRLPHRPDVRAEGFTLPRTHLEVHVTHPPRRASPGVQHQRGASTDAYVEEAWRRGLRDDYGGGPPADAAFDLVPVVVNAFGGWHPDFARLWRGAVRAAAERAGPTASQAGMLWRTVGVLAVTLQRQNFQVLAGCAFGLEHEVRGRLGRTLSEEPQFWRAAPEEALDWGRRSSGPRGPKGWICRRKRRWGVPLKAAFTPRGSAFEGEGAGRGASLCPSPSLRLGIELTSSNPIQ